MLYEAVLTKGYIIPGFILLSLFLLLFLKPLKKKPIVFYVIFTVITLTVCKFYISKTLFGYTFETMNPNIFYWISMYKRGVVGFLLFLTVMGAGVLNPKNSSVRSLLSARGELSVIASIASLCHLIIYGYSYITRFLSGKTPDYLYTFLFVTSGLLMVILIPLFVTSFIKIRRKMDPVKWKKLQKWAYTFYVILFINVITVFLRRFTDKEFVLNSAKGLSTLISLSVYIGLFIAYGYLLMKKKKGYTAVKEDTAGLKAGTL